MVGPAREGVKERGAPLRARWPWRYRGASARPALRLDADRAGVPEVPMPLGPRPPRPVALAALALVALAGCVPGASPGFGAPSFALRPEATAVERLELGPYGARLVLRTALAVTNPNPVGLRLASLDGGLALRGVPAADVRFVGGVDVPAGGGRELALEVGIPLPGGAGLVDAAIDLLGGAPVAYRVDASVGVEVLGVRTAFPRTTLLTGELRLPPLAAAAPRLRWVPEASGLLGVRSGRVVLALAFDVTNPGVLDYRASAPDAVLRLDGREVARLAVPATRVPAGGTARWTQELALDPVALGASLAARLAAGALGAPVEVALAGAWTLDLGPLGRVALDPGTLGIGSLD